MVCHYSAHVTGFLHSHLEWLCRLSPRYTSDSLTVFPGNRIVFVYSLISFQLLTEDEEGSFAFCGLSGQKIGHSFDVHRASPASELLSSLCVSCPEFHFGYLQTLHRLPGHSAPAIMSRQYTGPSSTCAWLTPCISHLPIPICRLWTQKWHLIDIGISIPPSSLISID